MRGQRAGKPVQSIAHPRKTRDPARHPPGVGAGERVLLGERGGKFRAVRAQAEARQHREIPAQEQLDLIDGLLHLLAVGRRELAGLERDRRVQRIEFDLQGRGQRRARRIAARFALSRVGTLRVDGLHLLRPGGGRQKILQRGQGDQQIVGIGAGFQRVLEIGEIGDQRIGAGAQFGGIDARILAFAGKILFDGVIRHHQVLARERTRLVEQRAQRGRQGFEVGQAQLAVAGFLLDVQTGDGLRIGKLLHQRIGKTAAKPGIGRAGHAVLRHRGGGQDRGQGRIAEFGQIHGHRIGVDRPDCHLQSGRDAPERKTHNAAARPACTRARR